MTERPQDLYRLWDDAGVLLYVGIAAHTRKRLQHHAIGQPWAWQVAGVTVEEYPSKAAALAAETAAIAEERPRHNVRKARPAPDWTDPEPGPGDRMALYLDRLADASAAVLDGTPVESPDAPASLDRRPARVAAAERRHAAWIAAGGEPSRDIGPWLRRNIGLVGPRAMARACGLASSVTGELLPGVDTAPPVRPAPAPAVLRQDAPVVDVETPAEPAPSEPAPAPAAAVEDLPAGSVYSREDAARLLGVSPRRVSQLAQDGRLVIVSEGPLRLAAESVHAERARRRAAPPPAKVAAQVDAGAQVAAAVEAVRESLERAYRLQIAAAEETLSEVRAERDRALAEVERARVEAAAEVERLRADAAQEVERIRAEVEAERAARAAAEERARRRWWRRS